MLDYIPFTKGQDNDTKVQSSTGGGQNTILKNQKYTLKFLQNKQNYAKINKVTDYQSLLNSPEQITTRSLDIQQYEYFLSRDGLENKLKEYKISKGQQTTLTRKQLQQSIKVENVHLNENPDHQKKLEQALNRSKFNRVGSIGESYRSQDSLSSIQKITRYQQLQQQAQYLVLQQQEEQNRQKYNQEDQSISSIKVEDQNIDISTEKHEEIILNEPIENENSIQYESQQQVDVQEQMQQQQINESYAISQFSVPQQYSINNEISLINYEEDEDNEEEEVEEQIQSSKKQTKNKRQPKQKPQKQQKQQQSNSKANQSIQSVKKSDGMRSNKISRQQSQMSISDLDRIEQIIQQNANDLDEAEELQRDKMRKQIRELEEKIQKTKERQEQFQYNPEEYKDMSGEYLQAKKKEQQQQQEQQPQYQQQQLQQQQQQQQQQQNQTQPPHQSVNTPKKQGKQEIRPNIQTQLNINKQTKQIKVPETQSQAVLPNINQNQRIQEHPMTAKSPRQEKKNQDINEIETQRISQHSIELEKSVVESLKDLENQQKHSSPIVSDPLIKIENKLKQMQEDIETHQRKQSELDFADFLLTSGNVFDTNYEKYKIFQVETTPDDPPGNFGEEEKNLYKQMKFWDAQNTGNSKKISTVADIVRGICTKLTSDANISEADVKTQKTIDSDWD